MDDYEVGPVLPVSDRSVTIILDWGRISLHLDGNESVYNLADVIGALVRPALLANGYSEDTVNKYVSEIY